jgi:hypothetical protein
MFSFDNVPNASDVFPPERQRLQNLIMSNKYKDYILTYC